MKKFISILLCFLLLSIQNLPVLAQKVKIPAGTPITVYVDSEVRCVYTHLLFFAQLSCRYKKVAI